MAAAPFRAVRSHFLAFNRGKDSTIEGQLLELIRDFFAANVWPKMKHHNCVWEAGGVTEISRLVCLQTSIQKVHK